MSGQIRSESGADALDKVDLDCGRYGADAVLIAVWGSVSAWWREQTKCWGHQQASLLHAAAADRIKGTVSVLSQRSEEDQARVHQAALAALEAWEQAGSPGLTRVADVTRAWVFKTTNTQRKGGRDGEPNQ